MKVLLIYLGRRSGGEIYSLSIAKSLSRHVEMAAMISMHVENIDIWREAIENLYEIDTYKNSFEYMTKMRKAIFEIETIISKEKPDIIYYPMLSPWAPMINFYAQYGKTVSTIHDYAPHLGDRNPVNAFLQSRSIKQSDGIILLSKYSQQQCVNKWRTKLTDVIPHGAFDFYLEDEEDRYSPVNGRANILFMGRIWKYKGLGILLEAYPLIKRSMPNSKIIIAGQGDISPYRRQLNSCSDAEVHNKYLSNKEIIDLLRKADVLVLPYIDASQSGVLTIGLAYGIPVIASRVGGLREQVVDRVTGILVEPGNSNQLAEECIKLLHDSSLREYLSRNEIKFARDSLSWEHIAESALSFFEKVLRANCKC